jgi:ABC-type Mn/Zn transport systems, ATPase component
MIVFDNVWFSYGNRDVLKGVSFTANFDERIAVLGESGGGKTTILKLIWD